MKDPEIINILKNIFSKDSIISGNAVEKLRERERLLEGMLRNENVSNRVEKLKKAKCYYKFDHSFRNAKPKRGLNLNIVPVDIKDELKKPEWDLWNDRSSKSAIQMMITILEMANDLFPLTKINPTKDWVSVSAGNNDFLWLKPQKRERYLRFRVKDSHDNLLRFNQLFNQQNIYHEHNKEVIFIIGIFDYQLNQNWDLIEEILRSSIEFNMQFKKTIRV